MLIKKLQVYLAANFILPFLFSTLFFSSFLLIFELFKVTSYIINKGISFAVVADLLGNILISFLPEAIPLSGIFAAIFALGRLSDDSEIIAMRSFGISKQQLAFPFVSLGIFIGALVFVLYYRVIPAAKENFKNQVIQITSGGILNSIRPGQFFIEIPKLTIFAEQVDPETGKLLNVFIHIDGEDGQSKVIAAQSGNLLKLESNDLGSGRVRLHLKGGNIIEFEKGDKSNKKIIFQDYDFPVVEDNFLPGNIEKDSMRTMKELLSLLEGKSWEELKLRRWVRVQLEIFIRCNSFWQSMIFVLLGMVLGIRQGRGRGRDNSIYAVAIIVGYYLLFFLGISMANKGQVHPAIAIFTPSLLCTGIVYRYYRKMDWAS